MLKQQKEKPRVRIAPSPTGPFHIGTARTALFNYLFAKKNEGAFILRIEDTDKERSKKEWENDIIKSLLWLGLTWDEGPNPKDINQEIGSFGPYHQSKRKKIYRKYLEKLIEEGKAYYCFCSPEELEAKRQYFMSIGEPPRYDGTCRNLTQQEVKKKIQEGKPFVIRLKTPEKIISFVDIIHGKIEIDTSLLGDFVLAKSFEEPLYNFACVIDDYEMKITHIIRGEDHIPNTPKQILIQEALGLPRPQYAHLPLILGPDKSKLSKRHGDVAFSQYIKKGFLPEAMLNFMAFLGWNPGDERELFNLYQLIEEFSLERCQKSPAIFNIQKLIWINGHYIRKKPIKLLTKLCIPYLIEAGFIKPLYEEATLKLINNNHRFSEEIKDTYIVIETQDKISFSYIQKIIEIYQERLKYLAEIPELVDFFFKKELIYPKELLFWKEAKKNETLKALKILKSLLSKIKKEEWRKEKLAEIILPAAEKFNEKNRGYLLWPLRVALSGKKASAGPFEIAEILGKEKTLKRIEAAQILIKGGKK